jgi:hypothetical protein
VLNGREVVKHDCGGPHERRALAADSRGAPGWFPVLAWYEGWELPGYVQWGTDSFTLTTRWRDPYGDDDLEHERTHR